MQTITTRRACRLATTALVGVAATAAASLPAAAHSAPASISPVDTHLMQLAGFAPAGGLDELDHSTAVSSVALGQGLDVELPDDADGSAHRSADGVFVNGPSVTGVNVVGVHDQAFAVITDAHQRFTMPFDVRLAIGTTLVTQPDGSIHHVDTASGTTLNMIAPAFAIDEAGTRLPAAYRYDAGADQLVIDADTTDATGSVLIDPKRWRGWDCVMALGLLGIDFFGGAAALAAAPWTGGASAWIAFALWQGSAVWAAYEVGQACKD